MLFGDVGTGKSFAAGCIANALLDRDVPVLMTNFPTILARLCGTFGEDRAAFLDSLGDYDLLIIDDLGAERNTEYALEQMFSIIDSRYRCKSLFNISPRPPWRHIFRPDCVKNPCNPSGLLRLFALQDKKSISPIRTR